MIGKLIGAAAGYEASRHMRQINGAGGAVLGAFAPAILRRIGLRGMIGLAAGSYLMTRAMEKRGRTARFSGK